MKQPLDHLRANKDQNKNKPRPERSLTLCLRPNVVGSVQALSEELNSIVMNRRSDPDSPETSAPKRVGQGRSAREKEIETQLAEMLEEIEKYEGEMRLRATWDDGKWRRWVDEHPPRAEGEPGYEFDLRAAHGICDADALIAELAEFAAEWNSEPLRPDDWADIFAPTIALGDKASMSATVVNMYEARLDFQQWRSGLSATLLRLSASASDSTSGSLSDDSTGGSPDSSTAATTKTATK